MFGGKTLIIRSSINMLLEDDVKTLMEFSKTKNALLVNVFSMIKNFQPILRTFIKILPRQDKKTYYDFFFL